MRWVVRERKTEHTTDGLWHKIDLKEEEEEEDEAKCNLNKDYLLI